MKQVEVFFLCFFIESFLLFSIFFPLFFALLRVHVGLLRLNLHDLNVLGTLNVIGAPSFCVMFDTD